MNDTGRSDITTADGWFIGDDKNLQWTIYDRNPATETSPPTVKNVTGWAVQFKLHTDSTGTAALTKSAVVAANGVVTVQVADTDTDALTPGTYHYWLRRTDDGLEDTLAWGNAVLQGRAI